MKEEILAILQQLIDMVQKAAPEVWRIWNRQVQVEAIQFCFWATFFLLATAGFLYLASYGRRKGKDDPGNPDYIGAQVAGIACAAMSAIAVSAFFVSGISRFLNPEYYAIMRLIDILK